MVFLLLLVVSVPAYTFWSQNNSAVKILKEAEALFNDGLYKAAIDKCKEVIRIAPRLYPAYNILGNIHGQEIGNEEEAISYFEKSLALQPKQLALYNNIASLCYRQARFNEAVSYLKKGLRYYPGQFNLNLNSGLVYFFHKKEAKTAVDFFNKALEKRPENERLLYVTGIAYLLTNKPELSLEYVTRLREVGNEYLASELEGYIRPDYEDTSIDMQEVMQNYYSKPPQSKTVPAEEKAETEVEISNEPELKIEGQGKVWIKQRFEKK